MVVRVMTDEPVTATVTIHVDQAEYSESFWQNQSCPCPWMKGPTNPGCTCFGATPRWVPGAGGG
jgi:hypothetical protein